MSRWAQPRSNSGQTLNKLIDDPNGPNSQPQRQLASERYAARAQGEVRVGGSQRTATSPNSGDSST
jgi:hypothetical protein